MDKKQIIEQLLKQGSKVVKGVSIKNVTVTPMENYVRLGLSLNKNVEGYQAQDDGTYKLTEVKVIFVSLFSIAANLRDNEDVSFAVNHILKNPVSTEVILNGATVNIIQQHVKAGKEYVNPWSEDPTPTTIEHDCIINHVVDINLSKRASAIIDKLAMVMVGC